VQPRIPEPSAWNPMVKVFIIGLVAGSFIGSLLALLMEYGGEVSG
jgi:hypothetical protein